jgi:hypothetical protein
MIFENIKTARHRQMKFITHDMFWNFPPTGYTSPSIWWFYFNSGKPMYFGSDNLPISKRYRKLTAWRQHYDL